MIYEYYRTIYVNNKKMPICIVKPSNRSTTIEQIEDRSRNSNFYLR